ncbi:hypothetical protein F4677DRAFT_444176 [Hypoxylon crocopeplum]|nr:hypothetical protein F4677DRAFT_444176 [Hypoxylon crocopeplum]
MYFPSLLPLLLTGVYSLPQATTCGVAAPASNSGTCKFTIKEVWTCEPVERNLYAAITLYDATGQEIYSTPGSASSPGVPINDADPWHLKEDGMEEELIIVAEHVNDYIQFYYGDQAWRMSSTTGTPSCQLKGDNWDSKGPKCPGIAQLRTYDCNYQC